MIKEFKTNDGIKLKLTEHAINHITKGDIVVRRMKGQDDMNVLSGGLHTYDAWIEFKKNYTNKLEHLHFFNSNTHEYWYYARQFSNGVIALRLPKKLFTGKAAKITMCPDEHYTSGYLWKTLFPQEYDGNKIIMIIEESLLNEDINQRKKGQIIGYINNNDPLRKMKVIIQHRGNEIKSVFPAWTQPNTGNNGKPFSHYDNIGFIISQSTEYFDDSEKINIIPSYLFPGVNIPSEKLHLYTPRLFTSRKKPSSSESSQTWALKRIDEIKCFNPAQEENDLIFRYLNDFNLVKNYPQLISGVYSAAMTELSENDIFYNTFQIVQNFIDGLSYLYISQQNNRLIETIEYMLNNMVSHTLFDLLTKKKIISTMIYIVVAAKNPELSYRFIKALAHSPIRREGYLDYNLDSINKKKLHTPIDGFPDELLLVQNPKVDINIHYEDFIDILKELIGETYTLNFQSEDLDGILHKIITDQSLNYRCMIEDSLMYYSKYDFKSLSENIDTILFSASEYANVDMELLINYSGLILRDFCRIQFAHRQRINARYFIYHDFVNDIYLPVDHDLLFGLILKHERWINLFRLEEFTDKLIKFSEYISSSQLKNDTINFKTKIGKEKMPLPER